MKWTLFFAMIASQAFGINFLMEENGQKVWRQSNDPHAYRPAIRVSSPMDAMPDGQRLYVEHNGERYYSAERDAYLAQPMPTLTPRQIRLGLLSMGVTDATVESLIDGIEDEMEREGARITWRYATIYERDHPLINSFAPALGLEQGQVDALWRQWSEME